MTDSENTSVSGKPDAKLPMNRKLAAEISESVAAIIDDIVRTQMTVVLLCNRLTSRIETLMELQQPADAEIAEHVRWSGLFDRLGAVADALMGISGTDGGAVHTDADGGSAAAGNTEVRNA